MMNNEPGKVIDNRDQEKNPLKIDVLNINMPVLIRLGRLIKPGSF